MTDSEAMRPDHRLIFRPGLSVCRFGSSHDNSSIYETWLATCTATASPCAFRRTKFIRWKVSLRLDGQTVFSAAVNIVNVLISGENVRIGLDRCVPCMHPIRCRKWRGLCSERADCAGLRTALLGHHLHVVVHAHRNAWKAMRAHGSSVQRNAAG